MIRTILLTLALALPAWLTTGCGSEGPDEEEVTAEQCAAWGGTMTAIGCVKDLTREECEKLGSTYRDGECISSEEYTTSD